MPSNTIRIIKKIINKQFLKMTDVINYFSRHIYLLIIISLGGTLIPPFYR